MPSNNRAKLNLRLPPEYAAKLEELAEKWNISKNAALLECIKAGAKNWEPYKPFTDYRKAAKPLDDEETKAAAIGTRPERKRQRQEPTNSEFWGTYEEGQAEAREAFPQAKAHGLTFEQLKANNAAYFDERGEEWRRGFADQFRKLEAEAEHAEAKTKEAEEPAQGHKPSAGQKRKPKAGPNSARAYREAGIKRGAKQNRNRELLAPSEFTEEATKAEAEHYRAEAEAENKEANAEIDRKLKALRADYQAGRISAAEYDRKAEALEDERPF